MPMTASYRIQAFPPGMALPPHDFSDEATVPPPRPEPLLEERTLHDELARVLARREALIARIALLKPHSRRRAELAGRLREVTLQALRLSLPERPAR